MGMMLRRYHKPLTSAGVGSSGPADAGEGEPEPTELEQAVLTAQEELATARDASEAANTRAFNATPAEAEELAYVASQLAEEAQAKQEALEAAQQALDESTLPDDLRAAAEAQAAAETAANAEGEGTTVETPSTTHGDLTLPLRMASTADWIAYANADPSGPPFDVTPVTGLRDKIAAHYLDAPA